MQNRLPQQKLETKKDKKHWHDKNASESYERTNLTYFCRRRKIGKKKKNVQLNYQENLGTSVLKACPGKRF